MQLMLFTSLLHPGLLSPLTGTDFPYWRPLTIIYPVFMVVAGIWVYLDANERTGNGLFWGALAFAVPPIGLPLYYILVAIHGWQNSRSRTGPDQAGREQMERERKKFVMQGEIERQKYLENAKAYGGTVYNPNSGMGARGQGHKHFTDDRAEDLINARKFDEAHAYLADMYRLASDDADVRGTDTYRFYVASLPDGLELVKEL